MKPYGDGKLNAFAARIVTTCGDQQCVRTMRTAPCTLLGYRLDYCFSRLQQRLVRSSLPLSRPASTPTVCGNTGRTSGLACALTCAAPTTAAAATRAPTPAIFC